MTDLHERLSEHQFQKAKGWKPDWRPISSAPRNGETITVRYRACSPYHAYWKDGWWHIIEYDCPEYPTEWSAVRWEAARKLSDERRKYYR